MVPITRWDPARASNTAPTLCSGAASHSYVWIVPDDIPDGTYRIVVAARAPSLMKGVEGDGLNSGASPPVRVGG